MAAHYFFHNEDIELICCSTFEEVFATVKDDSTILGMAAIENTIAGSLLHNYELLCDSGLTIVGEHKLRISHSLLCLPDDNLEDITEVHSHPVALMQCREFLARHPRLKSWKVRTRPARRKSSAGNNCADKPPSVPNSQPRCTA